MNFNAEQHTLDRKFWEDRAEGVAGIKLLVLADIEELRWRGERGSADVIISCGDVADGLILEAVEAYACFRVFAVKGNHDAATPFPKPIVDLHFNLERAGGLLFGGFNGCWKYKPRGHFLYEQAEVERPLSHFPHVDVFVAHNSPRGIHERGDEVHTGFEAFNRYLARCQPTLMVHSHQHIDRETMVGSTRVIGIYGHKLIEL